MASQPSASSIARRLPDLPRWIEARDLLLWNPCEIFGVEEPELACVLRDPETKFLFVVGAPAKSTLERAIRENGGGAQIIAPMEQAAQLAAALPGWTVERIIVHRLGGAARLPDVPAGAVRFLEPDSLPHFETDARLARELASAATYSPIAATFVDGRPVSFCYSGATTEQWWDVAIDTLPAHRRQGHAALCVSFMILHMRAAGREPIWQALASNPASLRLAHKLGFTPVDELALLTGTLGRG